MSQYLYDMAIAKIVLRKKLKNEDYRVSIRYAHLKEAAKYINLPFKCKLNQWNKEAQRFKRNKKGYRELNEALSNIEDRIDQILTVFKIEEKCSFESFKNGYFNENKKSKLTIKQAFLNKLTELEKANRYGSLITYKGCLTSLGKYTSLNIDFDEIDFQFLKGFEQYHLRLGNKPNTIGNYLRSLRALHYEFCKVNDLPEPSAYKSFNIARFRNETAKRSLSKDQLIQFINYSSKTEAEEKAKQLFLFSFYCRGANIMDMLQFTEANIIDSVLTYQRYKTGKILKVKLIPDALNILAYFKNDTPYLFPYLRPDDITKYRVRSINRYVNEKLQQIGESLNFKYRLSFYVARHSFAELNYKAGIRIEIISQMLGHSDLKTTQTYLRQFSDDEVDEAASTIFDSL